MTILRDRDNNTCSCVGKHVPLPHKLVSVEVGEDTIHLCPTTYYNLLCLREEYVRFKGTPPGNVRKHYSEFVQKLAALTK